MSKKKKEKPQTREIAQPPEQGVCHICGGVYLGVLRMRHVDWHLATDTIPPRDWARRR